MLSRDAAAEAAMPLLKASTEFHCGADPLAEAPVITGPPSHPERLSLCDLTSHGGVSPLLGLG